MSLARSLWRHRTTTLILICTMGPAAGAATSLFSAVDRVLLSEHGVRDSDQILHLVAPLAVFRTRPERAQEIRQRAASSALIRVRAFARPATVFQIDSEAIVDWGIRPVAVSPEFFELVGVQPRLGTSFAENDLGRRPRPAIISERLWRNRFAADPLIVGRVVDIPGSLRAESWTIIGVMPKDFNFPRGSNFWLPFDPNSFAPSLTPDLVRVNAGTTVSALEEELPGVGVQPFAEYVLPQGGRMLIFCFVGVTLFVLVAWVQTASRILTQLAVDAPATALRLSLGATPFNLVGVVAQEACLVASLVLAAAVGTTILVARFLTVILPAEFLGSQPLFPDWRSWAFLCLFVACGTVLWIIAARTLIARSDPAVLQRTSPAGLAVHSAGIARKLLILQMSVVTALLYCAFLSYRSYQNIAALNVGFNASNLISTPIPVWGGGTSDPSRGPSLEVKYRQQSRETLRAIQSLDSVSGASFTNVLPLSSQGVWTSMSPGGDSSASVQVVVQSVGLGFFSTIGASIVAGREPEPEETRPPPPLTKPLIRPAVINERLARILSPAEAVPSVELWSSPSVRYRIVGVVRNIPTRAVYEPAEPCLYAFLPEDGFGIYLVVRSESTSIRAEVRKVMAAIWGESLAPRHVTSVSDTLRDQSSRYQASALVFGILIILTFPVALVGIAGAVIDETRRRVPRTALEVALGASPARIRWSIVADVLYGSAIGSCLGMFAGVMSGIAARSALFAVHPTDAMGIAICSVLPLVTVGFIALALAWPAGQVNFTVLRTTNQR